MFLQTAFVVCSMISQMSPWKDSKWVLFLNCTLSLPGIHTYCSHIYFLTKWFPVSSEVKLFCLAWKSQRQHSNVFGLIVCLDTVLCCSLILTLITVSTGIFPFQIFWLDMWVEITLICCLISTLTIRRISFIIVRSGCHVNCLSQSVQGYFCFRCFDLTCMLKLPSCVASWLQTLHWYLFPSWTDCMWFVILWTKILYSLMFWMFMCSKTTLCCCFISTEITGKLFQYMNGVHVFCNITFPWELFATHLYLVPSWIDFWCFDTPYILLYEVTNITFLLFVNF